MKKILTSVAMVLLLAGCASKYDDSDIQARLSAVETKLIELQGNIMSLQSAIGDGVFVAKVQEYADPATGKTIGVTVTYTNGDVKYFEISPKADYDGPVLGVIKNGAGQLVWAVDGQAIKLGDNDIPVYLTPVFSLDEEGYLWVEVDGQKVRLGQVQSSGATLEDGIFTDIKVTADEVILTLSDGSTVSIPFAEPFKLSIETDDVVFEKEGKAITIPYTVSGKTEGTVVGVMGYNPNDFQVEVTADNIVITPIGKNAAAVMTVYADSKIGLVSMVQLTVNHEVAYVTNRNADSIITDFIIDADGGTLVANVMSNVEFDAVPDEAWITVVETKAMNAHTITLSIAANAGTEEREGCIDLCKKGTTNVIYTIFITQEGAVVGAKDLSKKESANCYVITEAGDYKFAAVKGNSNESVGDVACTEILWETWNNAEEVEACSVIAQVGFADGFVTFSTPETLKPGNAVIAAKDAADVILWSWHIWVPETEIVTGEYGIYSAPMMDRNLGALVAATAEGEAPVESFGLTYQWGRKDPFPGPQAANSSDNATVAGVELSQTEGAGEADECKITLEFAIQNPTVLGHAKNGDWLLTPDNTLWQNGEKTIFDPCPPGYRVPARDKTQPFHGEDLSTAEGWQENAAQYWFALGNPLAVFPFAGYRDDYGPKEMSHAFDRAAYWTAYSSADAKGYYVNIRAGSAHALAEAGKSRAGSVRCVANVVAE